MAHDEQRCNFRRDYKKSRCPAITRRPPPANSPLWLGIDLGTCDVVSMVVDRDSQPVAVCLGWADVVRDGIVWDFFGAVTLVRRHHCISRAAAGLPLRPCGDIVLLRPVPILRISINVTESAGLEIGHVLDELTAVADLPQLDNAGVVIIGGGTAGIAIVKQGRVTCSADKATGIHHISLTLAGDHGIGLEEAEQYKRSHAGEIWPVVKPVYEKMAEIVARHICRTKGLSICGWQAAPVCSQACVSCFVSASRRYRCICRS
ncbi:ethanolamine utilization protein EutJ [Klebsiella pneumoniae]|nr:ethanolamine utilization protein EutJ [Klebsiella pneumoniae]